MRSLILSLALVVAACGCAASAEIGKARSVRPDATGQGGALSAGAAVHADETVKTGQAGQAGLQFHDSTNLHVGPSSSVTLGKHVYDPNRGAGATTMSAARGAFRLVTPSGAGRVEVKTPHGTLGIRG